MLQSLTLHRRIAARRRYRGRYSCRPTKSSNEAGSVPQYVVLFVGLVTGVLVINAALDLYFVYQDNRRASIEVQKEKAEAAAQKIESFVREIELQIAWVTQAQWAAMPIELRRIEYFRLLRQAPAIIELVQLDRQGREQLRVSRISIDVIGSDIDRSAEPAFVEAMANRVYFGTVHFRQETEPWLTMAVAHDGKSAVTVAEVNLKLIQEVVSQIKVGKEGYAYVVDRLGRLVTHPDLSLVLRATDMSGLAQVALALAPQGREAAPVDAPNRAGVSVLSAHAAIPALNWLVFVEVPTAEVQQPVVDAGLRALALLVLGLLIAGGAAALLARRMVVPIRAMQQGAERVGGGELGHRLSIKTGDELEALAEQFNRSAAALEESYAGLEKKVEERTQALTRSIDELTASSEILRLIASAPDDLEPMFETLLDHATRLCGAQFGILWLREGDGMIAASLAQCSCGLRCLPEARDPSIQSEHCCRPDSGHLGAGAGRRRSRQPEHESNASRNGRPRRRTHAHNRSHAAQGSDRRRAGDLPPGGAAVRRGTNQAGSDLRRPGGYRHRELAPARRAALAHDRAQRVAGEPDGNGGGAAGHLAISDRCAARPECRRRGSPPVLRSRRCPHRPSRRRRLGDCRPRGSAHGVARPSPPGQPRQSLRACHARRPHRPRPGLHPARPQGVRRRPSDGP